MLSTATSTHIEGGRAHTTWVAGMEDDTGDDVRTETTTLWDTGTDFIEADVATDEDPQI